MGVCIPAVFSKTGGPGGPWGPGDWEAPGPGPGPGLVKNYLPSSGSLFLEVLSYMKLI